MDATKDSILIDGNSAAALGAVYAGATVGAWYPITPSTSLMEAFKEYCERFRVDPATKQRKYALIQAEDELAAAGMVIGAGWCGARAFTSTAGPGISLMSEFIGLAYYTEIPGVFFDIQRTGPSTGMPTRTQQGDLLSIAYLSHGDTKHIALFPANPEECFYARRRGVRPRRAVPDAGVRGVGSGHRDERLDVQAIHVGRQLPSRSRQSVGRRGARQDRAILALPRCGRRRHRGAHVSRRASAWRLLHAWLGSHQARDVYRRLRGVSGSGRSPRAEACDGGARGAGAGAPHAQRQRFAGGDRHHFDWRMSRRGAGGGAIACAADGVAVDYMRIRAFPFAPGVRAFIEAHPACYVVEQNRDGQLRTLLAIETGLARDSMTSILDYGGLPLTADVVVRGVGSHLSSHPWRRAAAS